MRPVTLHARLIGAGLASVGLVLAVSAAFAQALSNTPATETQISALIPNPPTPAVPVRNLIAFGVIDNASPTGGGDCEGHVQSAAYDLRNGLFLYAYQLECHCAPNWDVGYTGAGGGLRVPLNGNVPVVMDYNNDGIASETSFHTTEQGFRPFRQDLIAMNDGDDFDISSGDFTTAANRQATHIEFLNANGIFLSGEVFGFVTSAPPVIVRAAHLGGSNTAFDLLAPGIPTVAIDAGHGSCKGDDPGTTGLNGTREATLVLDIAGRVAADLRARGYRVVLTRPGECSVRIRRRAEIANQEKAGIFVSIHLNGSTDSTVNGTEVWVDPENTQTKVRSESLARVIAQEQATRLGLMLRPSKSNIPGVKWSGFEDPWLKPEKIGVLRLALMPAALDEVAFLSNPEQERLLNNPPDRPTYRQEVALAIAGAITQFFQAGK